jgi:transposase-like protein
VADGVPDQCPKLAALMDAREADVPADVTGSPERWQPIWSTHPRERRTKAVQQRTAVVASSPNAAAVTRLVGAVWLDPPAARPVGRG